MEYSALYKSKLRTPEEAVRCVKSGDWVDYTSQLGFPYLLDKALAGRRDELRDVKVRGNLMFQRLEIVECDLPGSILSITPGIAPLMSAPCVIRICATLSPWCFAT